MSSRNTTQSEISGVYRAIVQSALVELNVGIPSVVTAVNNHLVTAQPTLQKTRFNGDGSKFHEQTTPITNVRILYPGSATANIQFPVTVGSFGYLHFVDYDIDEWNDDKSVTIPDTARTHDQNDCVFQPAFSAKDEGYNHDCIKLTLNGIELNICDDGIHIVGDVTVDGEVTANGIALSTHSHPPHNAPPTP